MKHIILIILLFTATTSRAQQFYLIGGIQASSSGKAAASFSENYHQYSGRINGGFRWTVGAELVLRKQISIELSNYSQKTVAEINASAANSEASGSYDENINWLMIKCNKYVGISQDKFSGFGGIGMGLASFSTKGFLAGAKDDSFAWQAQAGLLFWPTKALGLKLSAEYQMAVHGTGLAFTSTVGSSVEITQRTPFSQFSGGLSLILDMNRLSAKQ